MRLINTKTGTIEEFIGDDIPKYAILSHTWEKDEISLQELQRLMDPDLANDPKTLAVRAKAGFFKVLRFVELAASHGIPYAWADTCCIDKTSSADLSESINSMYRWYKNSEVCFAYLADVTSPHPLSVVSLEPNCRWFTRGWTLQELIAPSKVEFYNHSWCHVGSRHEIFRTIENITGISSDVFESNDLSAVNIAQKMSWAAKRTTTRKEDMAYCLLGLFDINMPLLYGEGEKAFLRLQEHIAATSTDHSLFAWGLHDGVADGNVDKLRSYGGIFARSPADFLECGDLKQMTIAPPNTWTQTNRGFSAVFPTIPSAVARQLFYSTGLPPYIDDEDYLVILNCASSHQSGAFLPDYVTGIWISLIDARDDGKQGFCRVTGRTTRHLRSDISNLLESSPSKFRKDLWLAATEKIQVPRDHFSKRLGGFLIPRRGPLRRHDSSFEVLSPYSTSDNSNGILVTCPLLPLATLGGLVGVVTFEYQHRKLGKRKDGKKYWSFTVIFGYPQSLKGPFAKVVHDIYDKEPLLQRGFQRYALSDNSDSIELTTSAFELSFCTVWHDGMIFTELCIDSCLGSDDLPYEYAGPQLVEHFNPKA